MNVFDRDFLGTLLADDDQSSVLSDIESMSDRDIEKIAVTLPSLPSMSSVGGGLKSAIGTGMQGLTSTVPVKTLTTAGGALIGGMQDPGYDPMTGQQNSRIGNILLGGAGGLAAGYGLQRGARAALGMKGATGDYLRSAQRAAAEATTHAADRGLSMDQLREAYARAGQTMPGTATVGGMIPATQTKGQFTMRKSTPQMMDASENAGAMVPSNYVPPEMSAREITQREMANRIAAGQAVPPELRAAAVPQTRPVAQPIPAPVPQGPMRAPERSNTLAPLPGSVSVPLPGTPVKVNAKGKVVKASVDLELLGMYLNGSLYKQAGAANFLPMQRN